ncbi:Spliceosome-associated protein CWC15 homolog [Linum perenne]
MTTAARPTWAPAKGGNEQGGSRVFGASQKFSSRDLAAHTTLKPRREGQDTQDELEKRNLREELEERERRHFSSKDKSYSDDRDRSRRGSQLLLEGSRRDAEDRIIPRSIDADDSDGETNNNDERWDDDVVFKNQTRGETKTPKRFINDTIRNDFHRRFLQKYMK